MPNITVTLGLPTPLTVTKTLSAGDMTKLQAAFTRLLQGPGDPVPTNQQIFDAMVARWFTDTIVFVRGQGRAAAAETSVDIDLT